MEFFLRKRVVSQNFCTYLHFSCSTSFPSPNSRRRFHYNKSYSFSFRESDELVFLCSKRRLLTNTSLIWIENGDMRLADKLCCKKRANRSIANSILNRKNYNIKRSPNRPLNADRIELYNISTFPSCNLQHCLFSNNS